ncbi:MAG TPA: uracil-DNA glycosylase [Thermodesulfobacteriota bacterium]
MQERVVRCRACPRLVAYRERVAVEKVRRYRGERYWGRPVAAFGDPTARLLIVGLAPAAHGANRTGRMFTGDGAGGSGDWVAAGLHAVGLANRPVSRAPDDGLVLRDALISAACRCAPPDNRPTPDELARCRPYLEAELAALEDLRVVVALGRIAFDAVLAAWGPAGGGHLPRPRPAFVHGGEWTLPAGPGRRATTLLATYHPSRQNTNTGRLTREMWLDVFRRAAARLGA